MWLIYQSELENHTNQWQKSQDCCTNYHNPTIYSKRSTHAFTSMIPIAFLKKINACKEQPPTLQKQCTREKATIFSPTNYLEKDRKTYLQRLWTMPKIYPSLYFHHFSSLSLGTSPWTSRTFLLHRSRANFSSASWCLLSTWISCALQIQFHFHSYSIRHGQ